MQYPLRVRMPCSMRNELQRLVTIGYFQSFTEAVRYAIRDYIEIYNSNTSDLLLLEDDITDLVQTRATIPYELLESLKCIDTNVSLAVRALCHRYLSIIPESLECENYVRSEQTE